MAIKKCRECGQDVSTKAKSCPHCGAPVKTTSIVAILMGLVAFVSVFMFVFGDKTHTQIEKEPLEQVDIDSDEYKFSPATQKEITDAKPRGVNIEPDAKIDRAFLKSEATLSVMLFQISDAGYRCDSISVARYKRMSRGMEIICNRFSYHYSIDDKGGNLVVSLDR